jgi:uncharacterized protein (DUF302 family)
MTRPGNDDEENRMEYAKTITLDLPYDEAVPRVKEAFKEQGFGTLTEIDVKATLKEKIDVDVDDYVILGACNPHLAHQALEIELEIGLLLPCNVVVRSHEGKSIVHALDPQVIAAVPGNDALQTVASEAGERISAALAALQA